MDTLIQALTPLVGIILTAILGWAVKVAEPKLERWIDTQESMQSESAIQNALRELKIAAATVTQEIFQTTVSKAKDAFKDGKLSKDELDMIKKSALSAAIKKTQDSLPTLSKDILEQVLPSLTGRITTEIEGEIARSKLIAKAGKATLVLNQVAESVTPPAQAPKDETKELEETDKPMVKKTSRRKKV